MWSTQSRRQLQEELVPLQVLQPLEEDLPEASGYSAVRGQEWSNETSNLSFLCVCLFSLHSFNLKSVSWNINITCFKILDHPIRFLVQVVG